MNSKVKGIVIPTVVLFVIAAVTALLLGLTNMLTKDIIATRTATAENEAIKKVIAAESYDKKNIDLEGKSVEYYIAKNGDTLVGYAVKASSNGYGGTVTCIVGVDTNGTITAVEVSDVSGETPGLGQNAKKSSFTEQYKGKSEDVKVVKNGAKENEVNAVTGATITSNAVNQNINTALKVYAQLSKEGGK